MSTGINFERIISGFHFTLNARDPNFIYQIILVNTVVVVAYFVVFTLLGKFRPALAKSIVMLFTPPFGVICFFVNFIIKVFNHIVDFFFGTFLGIFGKFHRLDILASIIAKLTHCNLGFFDLTASSLNDFFAAFLS